MTTIEETISNVHLLSAEKYEALAEQYGWSLTFSEGYISGLKERRLGKSLSTYLRVGVDEYALGFRAGYYGRVTSGKLSGTVERKTYAPPKLSGSSQ